MSHIHHECELERHIVEQLEVAGWLVGKSADYDVARALFPEDVICWLDDTQPQAMAKLRAMNGAGTETVILDRLIKQLDTTTAKNKATFPVYNPSTGEVWAKVADAGRADAVPARADVPAVRRRPGPDSHRAR